MTDKNAPEGNVQVNRPRIVAIGNGWYNVEVRLTREELSWLSAQAVREGRTVPGLIRDRAVLALPEEAFGPDGYVKHNPEGGV